MKNKQVDIQKITVHVSKKLLQNALKATHKNITETVNQALRAIAQKKVFENLEQHRGKVKFSIDFDKLREDQ